MGEYTLTDNPRDRAAELLASVPGTRPVNLRSSAQRARRGSECCWAIEQQALLRVVPDDSSPRRNSDSDAVESPAVFWEEPVMLGGPRRPSVGHRACTGIPRADP